MLIGADLYYKFVTGPNVGLNDELIAVETMFSWVLHGPLDGVAGPYTLVLHATTTTMQGESPKTLLLKLFDLDGLLQHDGATSAQLDEDKCLEFFRTLCERRRINQDMKLNCSKNQIIHHCQAAMELRCSNWKSSC